MPIPIHVPWHVRQTAAQRVGFVVLAGIVLFLLQPASLSFANRLLITWDASGLAYLALGWITIFRADSDLTRLRARSYDASGYLIFVFVLIASTVSMVAIVFLMHNVKTMTPVARGVHLALSIMALLISWALIHTVFAFHYAREFYAPEDKDSPAAVEGLRFPDCDTPSYIDFAYYAFVIGMTSQTSDVAVSSSEMRRTTLAHSVMSFIFNIAVLALSINVIGSAL